ncbi:hypothetical protein [Verrucomicrobium sp. BvORR034]|uniref:hypothetical protein n=1 Tax=Verrucomicrobium sp. BvORR034 TaxID=1396418 RepID=UPI0006795AF1|nr:hypothetical protein [Verrucomicrobium sp. BvORR034]
MPGSFNGIGTAFYGERNYQLNGSYITTEWIILFYLPIIPIRSLRIARNPQDDVHAVAYHSESYYVLNREPLCWAQVFSTYGFIVATIAWILGVFVGYMNLSDTWKENELLMIIGGIIVAAAPFFLLVWLRHRSKKILVEQLHLAMLRQNDQVS